MNLCENQLILYFIGYTCDFGFSISLFMPLFGVIDNSPVGPFTFQVYINEERA